MNQQRDAADASSEIKSLLGRLRGRIRRYVTIEGVAAAIAWAAGLFVAALIIDYVPILLGLTEMPAVVRGLMLCVLVGGAIYLFVKLVVIRWLVPLTDRSLALLVERYHGEFRESLVTTVENPEVKDEATAQMLSQARSAAIAQIEQVDLSRIFDRGRLNRVVTMAVVTLIMIGAIGLASPETLSVGARRLLMLDDVQWPRSSLIEVAGVRIVQDAPNPVLGAEPTVVLFVDGQLSAAKGTEMVLLVRAKVADDANPDLKIPSRCIVNYRTSDGERGFQYMDKVGLPRDGYQWFELTAPPFKNISADVTFDVRGDDARIWGFKIELVDAPTVVDAKVDCTFPAYMVDEETQSWTPRSVPLVAGLRLPVGTQVEFDLKTNKPLKRVWAYDPVNKLELQPTLSADGTLVSLPIEALKDSVTWEFTFEDQDGVISESPYRAEVLAFEDQAPKVRAQLVGIGDAITPEAIVPVTGTVEDDFGVERSWLNVQIGEAEGMQEPLTLEAQNLEASLDLLEKRRLGDSNYELTPDAGVFLRLSVGAEDRFDLDGGPNMGQGEAWQLEIVSGTQLLRRLERKEAAQRQMVEQIRDELTTAHNLLVRMRSDLPGIGGASEPGDAQEPGDAVEPGDVPDATVADLGQAETRLVFAQRVMLQLQKSRQELIAVAETFDNIRLQLINNRVDSEDRKQRLEMGIVLPLRTLIDTRFQSAAQRVEELRALLEQELQTSVNPTQSGPKIDPAVDEMQLLLVELDNILEEMLKFESYNELLDVVRELIKQQERLLEETEKERKRQAFEDLIE